MKITSDVDDLAAGATLLGSGGGGDTAIVASMLRHALPQHGPVPPDQSRRPG
ncbi:S-methyl thiohydantoin desulfurase domain-containing protein [Nonomuraea dietziae]|uniref:S-methyl thiohydantoin desulfurase domain-containing protein n=1 Tax=Nonomuraea dietziae TaxID=65515 RepID=UPI00342FEB2F